MLEMMMEMIMEMKVMMDYGFFQDLSPSSWTLKIEGLLSTDDVKGLGSEAV